MNGETSRNGSQRVANRSRRTWQLGVIFGMYLLVGLNSGGFGVVLPYFIDTYHLNKSDSGILFLAVTVGYLIAALAGSWLTARFGLRTFIAAGLVLFGVGSLMFGLLLPLALAILARLVLGFAGAMLETGGNFYVAVLPRNTALFNYLHAFFGAGALIGPLVAISVIGNQWGWQSVFLLWLAATTLLGLAFIAAFRHTFSSHLVATPVEDHAERGSGVGASSHPALRLALLQPVIWLATLFLLVYVGAETTVGSWSYTFLTEGPHLSSALSGGLVSLYWLGLTAGRLVLGGLAERMSATGQSRLLVLGCICGSLVGAALVWQAAAQPVFDAMGLFLIGFSYGPLYPTTLAVLAQRLNPAIISGAISVMTGLSIAGVAVFPWLAGHMLDMWGLPSLYPYVFGLGGIMLVLTVPLLRPTGEADL